MMLPITQPEEIRSAPCARCYICGTEGLDLYRDLTDRINHAPGVWSISRCPNPDCGVLWLNPMPLEEDIDRAYVTYYTHGEEAPEPGEELRRHIDDFGQHGVMRRLLPLRKLRNSLRRGFLASAYGYSDGVPRWARFASRGLYLQPLWVRDLARWVAYLDFVPQGRLLDVGCGNGRFVEDMQTLGWKAEGVEVDPRAACEARRRGLQVRNGKLTEIHFEDGCFDAVVINHVLEHVHDPVRLLEECHRILRPGGALRVFVPNAGGLGHRQFRRNWGGLDPPRHLYHFTVSALGELGERAGFRVRLRASSAVDRYLYHASFALAAEGRARDSFLSVARLYAIDFRDTLGGLFGREWGEEIALLGEKAPGPP